MVVGALAASDIEVTESVIVGLLLVAALVAIGVSRVRIPYTWPWSRWGWCSA